MKNSDSFAGRAMLAVGLMIGFYLLALLVAGLLIAVIIAMVKAGHLNIKIGIFCLAGAGIILWSILPRLDRFRAPGPALTEEQNPRLFAVIREIAAAVGQEPPSEVYLVGEVNAGVAERGGLMGIGTRRIMILGLPLIGTLSVDQLRAVLAHEFGHYDSGDTKLGPWIYRTRASIVRTVANLGESESWLDKPFRWYGEMYLRVTQGISRQQEFSADAIAARVVGAKHVVAGLTTTAVAAAAFAAFWEQEFAGALDRGVRPPLLEGFRSFLGASNIAPRRRQYLETLANEQTSRPFDSHPSLRERAAALAQKVDLGGDGAGESAAALIGDVAAEELRLLRVSFGDDDINRMQAVPWQEMTDRCHVLNWRVMVEKFAPVLPDTRLPELLAVIQRDEMRAQIHAIFKSWQGLGETPAGQGQVLAVATAFLGYALATSGRKSRYTPGEPILFEVDGQFEALWGYAEFQLEGEAQLQTWADFCRRARIAEITTQQLLQTAAAAASR